MPSKPTCRQNHGGNCVQKWGKSGKKWPTFGEIKIVTCFALVLYVLFDLPDLSDEPVATILQNLQDNRTRQMASIQEQNSQLSQEPVKDVERPIDSFQVQTLPMLDNPHDVISEPSGMLCLLVT